jgi:hypothetical protein
MTGPDVERAQRTLNGLNTFDHDYFGGKLDGEFGPVTAQAAKQAKFWLGYKEADLKPIYGDRLHRFLTGAAPLPADFAARRQRRLAAAAQHPSDKMGAQAVEFARQFVNKHETPKDSNHFAGVTDWYGMGDVSYCMEGVSRCYVAAGSEAFHAGSRYAYVPFFVSDAQRGVNGLHVIGFGACQVGDPVAFDWDGGVADHVGLFVKKLSPTTFATIEFNTSPLDTGSQSNGGGCYAKVRNIEQVEAFVRVSR